jgi:hypothetical protein
MHKRKAAFLVAPPAVLGLALIAISGGLASAAPKPAGGVVHVYEVSASIASPVATDVLTGAITDHGKDHSGVAGKGTINKIDLSKGSFEVNIAKFVSHHPPPVDPKTCSFADSFTASAPIVKGTGTGAYAGIRGTFKVTVTNAGILPKLKSGKCNESPNATPVAGVSWAKGSATVSFK